MGRHILAGASGEYPRLGRERMVATRMMERGGEMNCSHLSHYVVCGVWCSVGKVRGELRKLGGGGGANLALGNQQLSQIHALSWGLI